MQHKTVQSNTTQHNAMQSYNKIVWPVWNDNGKSKYKDNPKVDSNKKYINT